MNLNTRKKRAIGFLDYLCGVNPMGLVYLTNMGEYGAETTIMQIYHSWVADGSAYDDLDPETPENLMEHVELAADQESVEFRYRRSVQATPGAFSVEWSTDLVRWNTVGIEERYTLALADETVWEEIRLPITRRGSVYLRFAPIGE